MKKSLFFKLKILDAWGKDEIDAITEYKPYLWNGGPYTPINPITITAAKKFLKLIPPAVEPPSICVKASGDILFYWSHSEKNNIRIFVCYSGKVRYLARINGFIERGSHISIDEIQNGIEDEVIGMILKMYLKI